MSPTVLIVFFSRCGATEKLALAAAVGAVQSRAGIRLRRLREAAPPETSAASPDCAANLDRMRKEYVAPQEADVLGADAVIFGLPPGFDAGSSEWTEFFRLLEDLRSRGALEGKVGAALDPMPSFLAGAMLDLGLIAVGGGRGGRDAPSLALGRRVAAVARMLEEAANDH